MNVRSKRLVLLLVCIVLALCLLEAMQVTIPRLKKEFEDSWQLFTEKNTVFANSLPSDVNEIWSSQIQRLLKLPRRDHISIHIDRGSPKNYFGCSFVMLYSDSYSAEGLLASTGDLLILYHSKDMQIERAFELWNRNLCSAYKVIGRDVCFFEQQPTPHAWVWEIKRFSYEEAPNEFHQLVTKLK